MRINRYLARSGIASRRKAEELVLSGSVFVNGKLSKDLAKKISESDIVEVDGKVIALGKNVYYALNKPRGYVTTKKDIYAKKTIFELLPNDKSLYSVGRLDKETSGLILITNDGDFGQNIIHPTKKVEKEYKVKTKNRITKKQLQKINQVIELEDGPAKFNQIKKISDHEIIVTIEEGRNRIVRRMIEAVGNHVKELERLRVGEIKLDIEEGKFRELTEKEVSHYV